MKCARRERHKAEAETTRHQTRRSPNRGLGYSHTKGFRSLSANPVYGLGFRV